MKLWSRSSKTGLDKLEEDGIAAIFGDANGNDLPASDLDFSSIKETDASPQISFPSWIINRYNPSDQLHTANHSVLQSLDETYKIKEQNTIDSVITYLDEVILEFVDSEEEKESTYGKLQCEVTSKKGHQFEIRLDKSDSTSRCDDVLNSNTSHNGSIKRITNAEFSKKIATEKLEKNTSKKELIVTKTNVTVNKSEQDKRKTNIIRPKGTSHLITVEASTTSPKREEKSTDVEPKNSRISKNKMTVELVKNPNLDSKNNAYFDKVTKSDSQGTNSRSKSDARKNSHKIRSYDIQLSVTPSSKEISLANSEANEDRGSLLVKKLDANPNYTSSSINNIRKTFEDLGLSAGKETNQKPISNVAMSKRFSYIHPNETASDLSKPVPKARPKSTDFSIDFQLHKISNQSGNKTELRRTFIDPIDEEETSCQTVTTKNIESATNTNSKNTPNFLKSKNNSFLKSDLFSSFNRIFNSKQQKTNNKEPNSFDCPVVLRTTPPARINNSVRGFDSFMLY